MKAKIILEISKNELSIFQDALEVYLEYVQNAKINADSDHTKGLYEHIRVNTHNLKCLLDNL